MSAHRKIVRNAARCRECGDFIESRHVHDFRYCKCGRIFVDGGTQYIRRGGDLEAIEDFCEFKLAEAQSDVS